MKLSEAIAAVEHGKKVQLKGWRDYIFRDDDGVLRVSGGGLYCFDRTDFDADWIIYEEEPKSLTLTEIIAKDMNELNDRIAFLERQNGRIFERLKILENKYDRE